MKGLKLRRLFGADRRKIHGISDGAAQQVIRPSCSATCSATFSCASWSTRRDAAVQTHWGIPNSGFCVAGFFGKYVKGGAGDVAGFKRFAQSRLVDQLAARAIESGERPFWSKPASRR